MLTAQSAPKGAAGDGCAVRLGRLCVRRRWLVLAAWLAVFVVLAVWARSAGPDVNDNLTLPGSDSQAATDLLEERFPSQANGTNPVVLRAGAAPSSPTRSTSSRSTTRSRRSRRTPTSAPRRARSRARAPPARQGQADRLHRAEPQGQPERPDDRRRGADRGAGRPGARRRPGGRLRRLRRPEGLQARDALERGGRPQHGRDRAAVHVRHGRRDGPADRHRDRRARLRAVDHHPDQPRRRGADRGADARDDDRARRGDRLRAVHRHPPPGAAARRDGHARVDRAGDARRRAARSCSPAAR